MSRKTGAAVYAAGAIASVLIFLGLQTNGRNAWAAPSYSNSPDYWRVTFLPMKGHRAMIVFQDVPGTAIPIHFQCRPILDKNGRPTGDCYALEDNEGPPVWKDTSGREWDIDFPPWYSDITGTLNQIFQGVFLLLIPFLAYMALYYLAEPQYKV